MGDLRFGRGFLGLSTFRWPQISVVYLWLLDVGSIVVFLFLGTARSFLKTKRMQRAWLKCICIFVPFVFALANKKVGFATGLFGPFNLPLTNNILIFVGVCTGSVICDFSFITLNRLGLRWIKQSNYFVPSVGIVIGNCVLAALYIWVPAHLGGGGYAVFESNPWYLVADWISAANILTAFAALVFVLVAFIMIVHRLAWPLVERFVYALARFGVFRHRKALATLGLALLTTVFPPVQSLGKRLLEIFTS